MLFDMISWSSERRICWLIDRKQIGRLNTVFHCLEIDKMKRNPKQEPKKLPVQRAKSEECPGSQVIKMF